MPVQNQQLRPRSQSPRLPVLLPIAVLAYGLALHWSYASIIQPAFAYSGRQYAPPEFQWAIFSWIIATLSGVALPRRITAPSHLVLWVLYVVTIAPTILMGTYVVVLPQDKAVATGLGFGVAFVTACVLSRRTAPIKPLIRKRLSLTSFWLAISLYSGFFYAYLAATAGLNFQLHSIFDVYDVRDDYKEILSGAGLLGYLVSAQANVVNPLIIARGLNTRRWTIVALGALGQLAIYSATGFKTVIFSIPAIIIVAAIFRLSRRPPGITFLLGGTGVVMLSAALDSIFGSIVWSSLFARRFLFTPGILSSTYVDYYSNSSSFEMLSHSVLAPFFTSPPHTFGPARTIGTLLSGSPSMSANANLFADGYAHFGWYGVAGIAVILAIFLRVLDRVAHGLPVAAASLVVLMPSITLSNTSMLTAMLSHGLVAMVALLAIAPSEWGRRPPRQKPKGHVYTVRDGWVPRT